MRHIIALAVAPAVTVLLFCAPSYFLQGTSIGLVFTLIYGIPISYITVLFIGLPITLYLKSINKISLPILAAIGFVLGSLCFTFFGSVIPSSFTFNRLGVAMLSAGIPAAIGATLYGFMSGITDNTQQLMFVNTASKTKILWLLIVPLLLIMLSIGWSEQKSKAWNDRESKIENLKKNLKSHQAIAIGRGGVPSVVNKSDFKEYKVPESIHKNQRPTNTARSVTFEKLEIVVDEWSNQNPIKISSAVAHENQKLIVTVEGNRGQVHLSSAKANQTIEDIAVNSSYKYYLYDVPPNYTVNVVLGGSSNTFVISAYLQDLVFVNDIGSDNYATLTNVKPPKTFK